MKTVPLYMDLQFPRKRKSLSPPVDAKLAFITGAVQFKIQF